MVAAAEPETLIFPAPWTWIIKESRTTLLSPDMLRQEENPESIGSHSA